MRIGSKCATTLILVNSLRSARSFHSVSKSGIRDSFLRPSTAIPRINLLIDKMSSLSHTSSALGTSEESAKYNFSWQQTMLRIKDPKLSVPFYEDLGFKLVHFYNFPHWSFSLYFLAFIPDDEKFDLVPGSPESETYLWNCKS